MLKKSQKQLTKQLSSASAKHGSKASKTRENSALEAVVGAANVKRWSLLKSAFAYETNEDFANFLLDLAGERLNRLSCKKEEADAEHKPGPSPSECITAPDPEDNVIETTPTDTAHSKKKKPSKRDKLVVEARRKSEFDVRRAPELLTQQSDKKTDVSDTDDATSRVAIKISLCGSCNTRHTQHHCPLHQPTVKIADAIVLENCPAGEDFARVSLPTALEFVETNTEHGLGVFAADNIGEFTQFGPLMGLTVKEVDIAEDSNMRDIWEIHGEPSTVYVNTEDLKISNWLRFIRPAPTRDERNTLLIAKEGALIFITTKAVKTGEELLYWQDSPVAANKKKLEKTSCGGCNMTFTHPLYYRIHCSVFHDIRYSLTIRKYHCKICGAAVLGKDNIMKHAAELHNGQGAYQCQFCKKFFLRLNYLEMHRTYGCSANPHRSRPLCDFCGRKFCQPQKLKVHIKRMHSDFAEVLKEFQCKICLKILGSRAALQRHLKEVHQKMMDGACSCSRCGKHFQNKSNLKIHMLTHSGIKPFKCVVKTCNAAFTTKQCLQFHYKKVHNFNEEIMPKIERSIDYTFEAYSGVDDQDIKDSKSDEMINEENGQESDESSVDDPPTDGGSSPVPSPPSSPIVEEATAAAYPQMKILTKGSKKWIADAPPLKQEVFHHDALQATFNRHETSNASLLVEAALDSVCSEPHIDIDVSTPPSLVNNLYTLPDVPYMTEARDINLMSPVGGGDYAGFHQEDFSPGTSPQRTNFVRNYINSLSPQQHYDVVKSPSPPRYDFGHHEHLSSDESNGMAAQNLSVHAKHKLDAGVEPGERQEQQIAQDEVPGPELKDKDAGKFDLELDLRARGLYEASSGTELDFRGKSYDLLDAGKGYEESEFRGERFEPLVLNASELQGLDMSARSFHNYSSMNRYHPLYPEELRLSYSPPAPSYTHADILRVVSLDLTPPGRHNVDLSLRTHSLHQIANSRLLSEHGIPGTPHRLLDQGLISGRILSDHTTNRLLAGNEQMVLGDESRILPEQARLSPFSGYSSNYHPRPPHVTSPTPYHHYSTYY